MDRVIKRAKSCVDPRKYSHQTEWKKRPEKDNYKFPIAKRITLSDQMIKDKKLIPGPPAYNNTGLKQKIEGFYGKTEEKCSVIGSTAYEKKYIPGPSAYESRGKSMSVILKEKADKYLFEFKYDKKVSTGVRVKKTNDPAPTSYEFPAAKDKTAEMRASVKNTFPKNEKSNFLSKLPSTTR